MSLRLSYIEFHDGEIESMRLGNRSCEVVFAHLAGYVKEAEEKYGQYVCRIRFVMSGVRGLEWSFFDFSEWVGDGGVLVDDRAVDLTSETLSFEKAPVKLTVTSVASGKTSWVTAESATMVIESIGERFDEFNGPIKSRPADSGP